MGVYTTYPTFFYTLLIKCANKTTSKHRHISRFSNKLQFSFENTRKINFLNQNYVFEKWLLIFVLYYQVFHSLFFKFSLKSQIGGKLFVILCTLVIYFQFKLIYLLKNELGLCNRILKESRNNIVFEKWRLKGRGTFSIFFFLKKKWWWKSQLFIMLDKEMRALCKIKCCRRKVMFCKMKAQLV